MSALRHVNLLSTPHGRRLLFGSLYLSEGAPIGYIWWALPTRLRVAEVPVEEITALTSVLVLPWVLKFLWAPLVDTLRSRRWTLRNWIISLQLVMGVALVPLLFLDLHLDFATVYPLLLVHAFAAATQDVSVDALSISTVPRQERGSINGWMQAGMLTGRSLLGGGALVLGDLLGNQFVILILIGVVWSSMFIVLFLTQEPSLAVQTDSSQGARFKEFASTLKAALRQRSTLVGLLFAAVGGAGFEAVGAVAGPYLIDRGFSSETVGFFFSVPVIVGMIGGALLGGHLSDVIGRRRSVGLFLGLMTVNIVFLAAVDAMAGTDQEWTIIVFLSTLYVCIGLFTASSYALFMDLTDPRLGATQFSAFMGATNGCESWATFAVGRAIAAFSYPTAFILLGGASLLALPVLMILPETVGKKKAGSL